MNKLTYATATYNREKLLPNLYNSLLNQTNKDFNWLIVDDGSKDGTKDLVEKWQKDNKINIEYVYKENGGKNTAIDVANQVCKTDYICYVDSDDYMSNDATEVLYNYFEDIDERNDIVGLVGRRAHYDGTPFNDKWSTSNEVVYFYEVSKKYGYSEDTVLVFKTNIVKQFHFPKIPDERFITESVFYQQFMYDYKMMMIMECIYLAEYQEVGYTSQGIDLFLKNPKGFLYSLWQNAYYSIKAKKSFKNRLYSIAFYYAWKSVLKTEEVKNTYKINWIYRLFGNVLKFKLLNECKKHFADFKNRVKVK